jgi:hypothetical protein
LGVFIEKASPLSTASNVWRNDIFTSDFNNKYNLAVSRNQFKGIRRIANKNCINETGFFNARSI